MSDDNRLAKGGMPNILPNSNIIKPIPTRNNVPIQSKVMVVS